MRIILPELIRQASGGDRTTLTMSLIILCLECLDMRAKLTGTPQLGDPFDKTLHRPHRSWTVFSRLLDPAVPDYLDSCCRRLTECGCRSRTTQEALIVVYFASRNTPNGESEKSRILTVKYSLASRARESMRAFAISDCAMRR